MSTPHFNSTFTGVQHQRIQWAQNTWWILNSSQWRWFENIFAESPKAKFIISFNLTIMRYIFVFNQMHIVSKRKDLTLDEALKTSNGIAVLGFFIEVTMQSL